MPPSIDPATPADDARLALDHLFDEVYDELLAIAHARLRRYRPGETIGTTALVHEAYLSLASRNAVAVRDRAHFLALASRAMRCVLVDYARNRSAAKRGGSDAAITLGDVRIDADQRAVDLLALDRALEALARHDTRLGRIIELRFFGGLSYDEIAEVSALSVPTVKRDWQRARAWLFHAMQADAS
jgi:RNA polymerase sigma factor (TIGR02999 family)